MRETIKTQGPFQLQKVAGGENDYVLTDQNESVLLGFKAEEQPDLLILLEEINYGVEA